MRVRVAFTVELDPSEWSTTFGIEGNAAIREDVRRYIVDDVVKLGVFGSGEVNATVIKG